MEAPRYDNESNVWQVPTRDYAREEKIVEDNKLADSIKEIIFFSQIATFSILVVIGCTIFTNYLSAFPATLLAIISSFIILLAISKVTKTIKKVIKNKR